MNLSRVSNPQKKTVAIERAGINLETFNTILSGTHHDLSRVLNLSRGSNSLNSATEQIYPTLHMVRFCDFVSS